LEEREEAKIFIDEFAKYDKEKKGIITVDDLYQIIQTLEKDVRIRKPSLFP
jgi:Ca2+-binding EF-hand superfamily protein